MTLLPKSQFLLPAAAEEEEAGGGGGGMDSSVGKVMFCSISRRDRILYSFNGGDSSLDSLARLCLSSAPPFHSHYFHSSSTTTFSFLFHSDLTYFAIVSTPTPTASPSPVNPKILRLLRQIRDSSHSPADDRLIQVIRTLIDSTDASMARIPTPLSASSSTSTKAPLLDHRTTDQTTPPVDVESSEPPPDAARLRKRARDAFWRHVKIVAAVDLLVCALLFGIWTAVCRGFRCLS